MNIVAVIGCLPPIDQARLLTSHFADLAQPAIGILHMPSVKDIVEQAYRDIAATSSADLTNLMMLLTIFGGSALAWNDHLLKALNATKTAA